MSIARRRGLQTNQKRNESIFYNLPNENVPVCKTFFVTTLGYRSTNNNILKSTLNLPGGNAISPELYKKQDGRGRHNNKKNKIDKDLIRQHVERYKSSISHYRKEHAPLRRYLPTDITIKKMHRDFLELNPRIQCALQSKDPMQ